MKRNKVSVNYIYNMLYQVLTFLTPIITAPLLARTLGSTNLGIYDYTYTIVNWFTIVGMLGISTYGNREIAKASATNDKNVVSKKFSEIFTLQMVSVLISFTIFILLILLTNFRYKTIFIIQGLLIFSSAFEISWFYAGMQDFKKVSIRNMILKLITVIGIVLLIHSDKDLILYTSFLAVLSVINSLILFYKIGDYVNYKKPTIKEFASHIKGSIALFIPQIATTIYSVFGRTLIGMLYTDINEVAFYNYAYRFTTMILYIVTTIGTVMLPRVVQIRNEDNDEEAKRITNKTLKVALLLSIPLAIGFSTVAPFFIPWFLTENFSRVSTIICFLAPTIVFISITNVLGTQYLIPFEKTSKYTISVVSGCFISLLLNFILIRPFGGIGAAITTAITEFAVFVIQYCFVRKSFNFEGTLKKFFKYLLAASIMGVVIVLIGVALGVGFITNVIQVLVGIIIYALFLYFTKDDIYQFLFDKFKDLILSKITRKIKKTIE